MRGLLPSLQSTGCCHRSVSSGSAGPHQLWPAGPRACRPQQLWPRALQHGLGSCGIRAQWLCGMWNPSRSGIEPLSPALEGRLLSTVPAGKSWSLSFEKSPWLFWFPLLDCNFPEGRNFCCGCYYLMHGSCSANPCWMNGLITQRATEIVERVRDSFDSDTHKGFPGGAVVKNPPAKTGDTRDMGSIPGSERSPGEGNGNTLQCSSPGHPKDWGAWPWGHKELDTTKWLSTHRHT